MKVLHITIVDYGGAGLVALRLHLSLKSLGVNSKMLVRDKSLICEDVVKIKQENKILNQIKNKLRQKIITSQFDFYRNTRPLGVDLFDDDRTIYSVEKEPLLQEAGIIHLHNIAGMVNYPGFFPKLINKPLVWTFHDMNPFTGGCHYAGDCEKYKTGCGACPQLGSKNINDLSSRIFSRKEKAYRNLQIYPIGVSRWMVDCANKSWLFKNFKNDLIHVGLPKEVFKKRERNFSRDLLGLPDCGIVILFGAAYMTERKGFRYLLEAMRLLKSRMDTGKIVLLTFGPKLELFDDLKDLKFRLLQYGYVTDEALLSALYSSADIVVIPSIQENLAQVCLEAMSCQTPVIGFNVGGFPDMIKHQETGLLVEAKNTKELAEQIEWMITHTAEREQMGLSARKLVEQEFTLEIQAKRYLEIYESILKK